MKNYIRLWNSIAYQKKKRTESFTHFASRTLSVFHTLTFETLNPIFISLFAIDLSSLFQFKNVKQNHRATISPPLWLLSSSHPISLLLYLRLFPPFRSIVGIARVRYLTRPSLPRIDARFPKIQKVVSMCSMWAAMWGFASLLKVRYLGSFHGRSRGLCIMKVRRSSVQFSPWDSGCCRFKLAKSQVASFRRCRGQIFVFFWAFSSDLNVGLWIEEKIGEFLAFLEFLALFMNLYLLICDFMKYPKLCGLVIFYRYQNSARDSMKKARDITFTIRYRNDTGSVEGRAENGAGCFNDPSFSS